MHKTTVYLPEELKQALTRISASTRRSEAELIREALWNLVRDSECPRPRGALFAGPGDGVARRVDEALVGMGEDQHLTGDAAKARDEQVDATPRRLIDSLLHRSTLSV